MSHIALSKTVKASYLRSFQLMGILFTPKSLQLIFIFLVCGQNFLYVSRKPSKFPNFFSLACMCDRVDFWISKSSDPLIHFFVKIKHFCCCFVGWFLILWQLGLNPKPVHPRQSTYSSTYPPVICKCHTHNLYRLLCRFYILLSTSASPLFIFILYLVILSCSFFK